MKLSDIKGFGESSLNKLSKAGIESPFDLACFFPLKYIDATKISRFDLFKDKEVIVVKGKLISIQLKHFKGLSCVATEYIFSDYKFSAAFFNQPFLYKIFKNGQEYCLTGRLKINKGAYEITAPKIIPVSRIRPVIPMYKNIGINTQTMEKAIKSVLEKIKIRGCLNDEIRLKYGLMDAQKAFYCMHFPNSFEELSQARHSLSIENISGHIKCFNDFKNNRPLIGKNFSYAKKEILSQLNGVLGYKLTGDQDLAVKRVIALMDSKEPMNVILQGDVGSGKTAVCFFAIAYAAANGYQSAFMAPTELLARQHYQNAIKLFRSLGITVELLTGSMTIIQREKAKANIKGGTAMVIIGTHSLFQKGISFKNLALVITDEQHRFGVNQRGALENKADGVRIPDCMVVSATPIPRTLSLILYGDLESIIIKEKPNNRPIIKTYFVDSKVEQMYNYIYEKAKKGEQSYIVCPRVHENSEIDVLNGDFTCEYDSENSFYDDTDLIEPLISAEGLYKKLSGSVLKDYAALLHGQMKDAQKTQIMEDFVSGKIKVLITTTVIEVGIDVPCATTIVIHNAERYGLSQLHQLRGRVGRGALESCCFLLATPQSYEKRLKFFQDCNDGFLLAEKDLENRGAGDFLGMRQHGESLTFSGEPITSNLLLKAKEIASQIDSIDEHLSKSQILFFKELTLN